MTTKHSGSKLLAWASGCALALSLGTTQAAPPPTPKAPAAKTTAKSPAPATTAAPSSAGIGKGDTELGVFGNYTSYDDTDLSLLIVGASLGKFLSDNLELRVSPALTFIDSGTTSGFGIGAVVSAEYLFRSGGGSPVVPFVGGGIGLNLLALDAAGTSITNITLNLGPTGGVKYFLSERYSLELSGTYLIGIGTSCGTDCLDLESDTLQTTFRFNYYY